MKEVKIGDYSTLHNKHPVFFAEIGINHNGIMSEALKLIDKIKLAAINVNWPLKSLIVKLQKRTVDVVYTPEELERSRDVPKHILENAINRGVLLPEAITRLKKSEYKDSKNRDLKHALEFTLQECLEIYQHCTRLGIKCCWSCWDEGSVDLIDQLNPPCYKIASASLTDRELLKHTRNKGRTIILSTGASDLGMIIDAVDILGSHDLIIMHCTSVYPTTTTEEGDHGLSMINLQCMETIQNTFPDVPIGFSSHDTGIQPTYAAAVLGARVLEKHITSWRGMWGSDQAASIEPSDLEKLLRMIREFQTIRGDGVKRIYPEEVEIMKKLRRKNTLSQT